MKQPVCFGYQVATPEVAYSDDLTCLYGDIEENIRLLYSIGYDAVEFMTLDPDQLNVQEIQKIAAKYNMRIPMVCTGELFGTLGLSFLSESESIRKEAFDRTCKIIDFASKLNANVNIGRLRGNLMEPREKNYSQLICFLRNLSVYAEERNVDLFLEPIEKEEINFINTISEGVRLAKDVNHPNFKLMADDCAMQFEEKDIRASVMENARLWIGHVHLTEKSRYYPGHEGKQHFYDLISWLKESGYEGPFMIELLPRPDQKTAAQESYQTIAPMLKQIYSWER